MVAAFRIGYVTARDRKALGRWERRKTRKPRPAGLTGANLERAIMSLALTNPEYIVVGR